MSDIQAFQSRIMTAMDRLATGVEKLNSEPAGDTQALKDALEEEKTVNAQLTERVRVLAERQEKALAAMEKKSNEAVARTEALDVEVQRLRQANKELQSACEALREANEKGVGEPHLINRALAAELDGMKAARRSEVAEFDDIIANLAPLLDGAADHREDAADA